MTRKEKRKNFREAVKSELREHKSSFIVFSLLRILVLAVMIRQIFTGTYENVYLCVLTLFLLFLPSIVQVSFKIELPPTLEVIILCFIFAAEILGEIDSFYTLVPHWDTMLHTVNGFLAAAIGYSMVWLLNNKEGQKFNLSPLYLSIVAFCFSMTIGVIWEFSEFALDLFFGMDTQKDTVITSFSSVLLNPSGLNDAIRFENITDVAINGESLGINGYLDIGLLDTMKDLFVNFIGALVFSIFGYHYSKNERIKSVELFIPTLKDKESNYLDAENRKDKVLSGK